MGNPGFLHAFKQAKSHKTQNWDLNLTYHFIESSIFRKCKKHAWKLQ